jgi:hypothetical protein
LSSSGSATTVHSQNLARNESGRRTGQKQRRVRNIVDLSETAQRNLLENLLTCLRFQFSSHVCFNETGRNRVDRNTARRELARCGFRKTDQSSLAGGVVALARIADERDDGRDVDDAT